jgi:hypothetical protein
MDAATLSPHHEIEQTTASATTKAVEEFLFRVKVAGRVTLAVKGAEADELPTCPTQPGVPRGNGDKISAGLYVAGIQRRRG